MKGQSINVTIYRGEQVLDLFDFEYTDIPRIVVLGCEDGLSEYHDCISTTTALDQDLIDSVCSCRSARLNCTGASDGVWWVRDSYKEIWLELGSFQSPGISEMVEGTGWDYDTNNPDNVYTGTHYKFPFSEGHFRCKLRSTCIISFLKIPDRSWLKQRHSSAQRDLSLLQWRWKPESDSNSGHNKDSTQLCKSSRNFCGGTFILWIFQIRVDSLERPANPCKHGSSSQCSSKRDTKWAVKGL